MVERLATGPILTGKQQLVVSLQAVAAALAHQSFERLMDFALHINEAFDFFWIFRTKGIECRLAVTGGVHAAFYAKAFDDFIKAKSGRNNANRAQEVIAEFGSFGALAWSYEPADAGTILESTTAESTALSKDLKKRGFSFVGPTTAYAFMQAMGIVNDHLPQCHAWETIAQARAKFKRPR